MRNQSFRGPSFVNVSFSQGVRGEKDGQGPGKYLPRITAVKLRSSRPFLLRGTKFLECDRDFADAAGDDQATVEVDFEIETDVNASELQKASAQ